MAIELLIRSKRKNKKGGDHQILAEEEVENLAASLSDDM